MSDDEELLCIYLDPDAWELTDMSVGDDGIVRESYQLRCPEVAPLYWLYDQHHGESA